MPGTFLTAKEREQLASFPDDIPHWDLITYFTLTDEDHTFLKTYRTDPHRLGVALQLGAVRYLGFCPTHLHTAPLDTIAFLAEQLHVDSTEFRDYGTRRMTRSAHFQAVLDHLGLRRVQAKEQEQLLAWLIERALEHDKPTLLLQMTSEHLKQQKMLRPGVTVLERLVVTARAQAHHESFHRLQPLLTPDCMAVLDRLLVPEEETGKTPLYLLRQYATSNTPPALLETLDKLTLLHSWAVDQWDMTALNPNRQKFLARLGLKYTVQALRRMGPERRYPILLALLKQTLIDLTDESIDIFDVCLASRHKKAREALKEYQYEIAETTEAHSHLLQAIGDVVLDDAIHDHHLRQAICHHIPRATLQAPSRKLAPSGGRMAISISWTTITAIFGSLHRSFWTPCPLSRIRMTTHCLQALRCSVDSIRPSNASFRTTPPSTLCRTRGAGL